MKKYILNKVFKNQKECDDWKKENLIANGSKFNGECILMVMSEPGKDDEMILTEIWTC